MQTKNLFIGTSGFTVQNFYAPEISAFERLKFYALHFNTVEINSTFYHFPRESTLQKWFSSVNDEFVFAFKVHGSITHTDDHRIEFNQLKKWFILFESCKLLKQQPIFLFQFPSSFAFNLEELSHLCDSLPSEYHYAFEFRHLSWFNQKVLDVVRARNIAIVYSDAPQKKSGELLWPKVDSDTADFFYVRFHGATKLYASSYSDDQLLQSAEHISQKLAKDKRVFAYFNNDAAGQAAANAKALNNILVTHFLTR